MWKEVKEIILDIFVGASIGIILGIVVSMLFFRGLS